MHTRFSDELQHLVQEVTEFAGADEPRLLAGTPELAKAAVALLLASFPLVGQIAVLCESDGFRNISRRGVRRHEARPHALECPPASEAKHGRPDRECKVGGALVPARTDIHVDSRGRRGGRCGCRRDRGGWSETGSFADASAAAAISGGSQGDGAYRSALESDRRRVVLRLPWHRGSLTDHRGGPSRHQAGHGTIA